MTAKSRKTSNPFLWGRALQKGERITVTVKCIRPPNGDIGNWNSRGGDRYPMILEFKPAVSGCVETPLTYASMDRLAESGVHFKELAGGTVELARNAREPDWSLVVVSVTPPPTQRRLF